MKKFRVGNEEDGRVNDYWYRMSVKGNTCAEEISPATLCLVLIWERLYI